MTLDTLTLVPVTRIYGVVALVACLAACRAAVARPPLSKLATSRVVCLPWPSWLLARWAAPRAGGAAPPASGPLTRDEGRAPGPGAAKDNLSSSK